MPIWIIVSYVVFSIFCIFSVVMLFSAGKKEYAKSGLATYIFYSVIFIAIWIFKLAVPSYIILLSMLTVLFSCFIGHYLGGYTKSKTFDRYLHAFGSFSFSLLFYCIISILINTEATKLFQAVFVFLLGNTLGVVFELIEAKSDVKTKVKSQKGLKDTNMDMLFNLIGSIISSLFSYFWLF